MTESDKLIRVGEKAIGTNRFFTFLDKIMSDPELRGYFDEFFETWSDIRASIMIMKTYQMVDQHLKDSHVSFSDSTQRSKIMIGIIKGMLSDSSCRQEMVKNMESFENGEYIRCKTHLKNKKIDYDPLFV